ncbi:MAG: hypothetical protein HOP07_06645 [Bacteriovoracaceae bacterium]|nr:hypothetical protein [Bacteriovoracaceae bacterium]
MKKITFLLLIFTSLNLYAESDTFVQLEGSLLYQTRNDQRIPGNGGTQIDLSDFDNGPFDSIRLYLGKTFNNRHEFRLLYAPLEINLKATLPGTVFFNGQTFSAGPSDAYYKFNSYRLTYAYHFEPIQQWLLAVGGTAKIRDAEVKLSQSGIVSSKKNTGFVPLVNFQALRPLGEDWNFRFDFDGLAAPQGRAFDISTLIEYKYLKHFSILAGYRMLEGGADNDKVYNFAWLHYATVALRGDF